VAALVVLTAGGCTRAKAKTVADVPPLDMPAPPSRDVEPTEVEAPQPVPLPQEPARNAPPRTRPAAPATRDQPRANEPPRPAPPQPEPPAPVVEPPPPEEPPKPPPTLQTIPPGAEAEMERTIRATLTRASNDLNHIDYRGLNTEARTQYDTAKSFIRGAEQAIRSKNLAYAKTQADKAAALAAQLGGK